MNLIAYVQKEDRHRFYRCYSHLYYAAFTIMIVKSMLYSSQFMIELFNARDFTSYLNLPVILLLLVVFVLRILDRHIGMFDGMLLGICLAASCASRSVLPVITALFLVTYDSEKLDVKCMALIYACIGFGFIAFNAALVIANIIPDAVLEAGSERAARYSLGFTHPNTLSNVIIVTLIAFYVSKPKVNRLVLIVLFAVALLIVLVIANSRTSACLVAFFAFLFLFRNYIFQHYSIFRRMAIGVLLLVVLLSFLVPVCLGVEQSRDNLLNSILSQRIYLWAAYLQIAPFSFFGTTLSGVDFFTVNQGLSDALLVDNAFVYTYIVYGLFYFLCFLFITLLYFWKGPTDSVSRTVSFVLLLFVVAGFVENYTYNIAFNIYLPFIYAWVRSYLPSKFVFLGGNLSRRL